MFMKFGLRSAAPTLGYHLIWSSPLESDSILPSSTAPSVQGNKVHRIHVDKGYRGHNYPHCFSVWISGQVRRVTKAIRREMRRRAAIEPVIGHLQGDHRMARNYLKGYAGDRANAVLAAAGYNFSLLLPGSTRSGISTRLLWKEKKPPPGDDPRRGKAFATSQT
jgi:hypothetical protein